MDADLDELSTQSRQRRLLLQAVGGSALAGGLGVTGRAMAQTQPLDTSILDVVIIGAGLSGLTSARDLQAAGCEVYLSSSAR